MGLALAAPALTLAAGPAGAADKLVHPVDYHFSPKKTTISSGDTVTWDWSKAGDRHNVTFVGVPDGARTPKRCHTRHRGTCARKFGKPGVYRYICTIHFDSNGMHGRVIVRKPG